MPGSSARSPRTTPTSVPAQARVGFRGAVTGPCRIRFSQASRDKLGSFAPHWAIPGVPGRPPVFSSKSLYADQIGFVRAISSPRFGFVRAKTAFLRRAWMAEVVEFGFARAKRVSSNLASFARFHLSASDVSLPFNSAVTGLPRSTFDRRRAHRDRRSGRADVEVYDVTTRMSRRRYNRIIPRVGIH